MSKIKRISYFKKNKDKIDEKFNFGQKMLNMRSELKYSKKAASQGFYITYWNKDPFCFKHKFFVDPSTDRFIDLTCSKNCIYTYMLAMDMEWIGIFQNSIPLSQWEDLVPFGKIRIELKENEIVVRYRDKYRNVVMQNNILTEMESIVAVTKKVKRCLTLLKNNPESLKQYTSDILKNEIDERHRDKK